MGLISNILSYPNFDKLEVVKTGTISVPAYSGSGGETTISHNLGYSPIPFGFLEQSNTFSPLPVRISSANFTVGGVTYLGIVGEYSISVDDVNIYITVDLSSLSVSAETIRYYLCRFRSDI